MSEELKACPFCGTSFKIGQEPDDNGFVAGMFYIYHEYGPIGHKSRVCPIEVVRHFNTKAEAIAAWNTRATDAENQRLRAEVEVLREEREKLLSQISDCRGSHWLGRQDHRGATPHLDAIWRGLVEVDDARAALTRKAPQ